MIDDYDILHDSDPIQAEDEGVSRLACFAAGVFVGWIAAVLLMLLEVMK